MSVRRPCLRLLTVLGFAVHGCGLTAAERSDESAANLESPGAPVLAPQDPKGPNPQQTGALGGQAKGLLALGASLVARDDYARAEATYRRVLETTTFAASEQGEALLGLARTYRRQGNFTRAAAVYERLLQDFPRDERTPEILLEAGRTLRALGAYNLAITRFYSVINSTLKVSSGADGLYPVLAKTAQFEIAETHFESGNYAAAAKFFLRLRLLDLAADDQARALFRYASTQLRTGDQAGAVTSLQAYLQAWPQDENAPEAGFLLATSLRELRRRDEALATTLTLLRDEQGRADPKRWAYWQRRTGNQLANDFYQQGEITSALAIYDRLATLATDPQWVLPVTYQIGLCHERLRAPEPARTAFRKVVETVGQLGPEGQSEELRELARMAAWRLEHLEWTSQAEGKLTAVIRPLLAPRLAAVPQPPSPPANDTK